MTRVPILMPLGALDQMLDEVEQSQVLRVAPENGLDGLRSKVFLLRSEIKKYEHFYEKIMIKIRQVEGEEVDMLGTARARRQLDVTLSGYQDYSQKSTKMSGLILNAARQRFDVLQKYGLTKVKNTEDFFMQVARGQVEHEQKEGSSPLPKKQNKIRKLGLYCCKMIVGAANGMSLSMIINPFNLPGFLVVSLIVGIGISALMLTLVKNLSQRARMAANPAAHYAAMVFAVVIYMVAEGALNMDGMIRVSSEAAIQAASGSKSHAVGDATHKAVNHATQHWSLLIFTLALVAFAAALAALEGRDNAVRILFDEKVKRRASSLKASGELKNDIRKLNLMQFCIDGKKNIKRPNERPRINWFKSVVRHLSREERITEKRISELGEQLEKKGDEIQSKILALSNEANQAQLGQNRTMNLRLPKLG